MPPYLEIAIKDPLPLQYLSSLSKIRWYLVGSSRSKRMRATKQQCYTPHLTTPLPTQSLSRSRSASLSLSLSVRRSLALSFSRSHPTLTTLDCQDSLAVSLLLCVCLVYEFHGGTDGHDKFICVYMLWICPLMCEHICVYRYALVYIVRDSYAYFVTRIMWVSSESVHWCVSIYSKLQIGWHRILRLFLKTFNLVPGVYQDSRGIHHLLHGTNRKFHG